MLVNICTNIQEAVFNGGVPALQCISSKNYFSHPNENCIISTNQSAVLGVAIMTYYPGDRKVAVMILYYSTQVCTAVNELPDVIEQKKDIIINRLHTDIICFFY